MSARPSGPPQTGGAGEEERSDPAPDAPAPAAPDAAAQHAPDAAAQLAPDAAAQPAPDAAGEGPAPEPDYGPGLARVRRRRWFLWVVLLIYLPTMALSQKLIGSFSGALPVFFGWVLLLIVAAFVSGLARCPRCGNYFHLNGMTLLYLRRCLHCQLHVKGIDQGIDKGEARIEN